MKIDSEKIGALRELLAAPHRKIVLVAHTNPDGDAIGASTAWREVLAAMGHEVTMIVPNKYPYFLDWMPDIREVVIFRFAPEQALEAIRGADILFCLDFNSLSRLEALSDALAENTAARRVLIDHHLSPDDGFDLQFSYPGSSSTCFLLYCIIEQLCGTEVITRKMAEALYVGMMTDTGNFAFSFLTPDLFRAVAVLLEKGIDIPRIHNDVYNGYTEDRARLFGYAIHRKMNIIQGGTVAYMSLTESEMRRYRFQQGDSEGFVNYPEHSDIFVKEFIVSEEDVKVKNDAIKKMKMSAMFLGHHKFIRVSLRSRGEVDVNLFARKYFDGGGHKNAAGGKSYVSMDETIAHYIRSVEEFAREGGLDSPSL